MPAYRSDAEAEIRGPVVERLRSLIPGCRIIHEINATGFGNRIDVLAVGEDRIAAVEIKSEKDKLDRLPAQIEAMRGVTQSVFAAVHERFLRHIDGVGAFGPDEARGATLWIYPKMDRKGHVECSATWFPFSSYSVPARCLPPSAINILWRDELHDICRSIGIGSTSRLNMDQAIDAIRWNMNGEKITKAICCALRRRECVEADDPVLQGTAA